MTAPRVVSLIASATEIVHAIGCGDQLVGRSHECDFPESVKRLPVCTKPRIDIHADSRTIDADIKSALRDGLSVYHVDAANLRELMPDVILTQTQCDVCAVSQRDVELALGDWIGTLPRIVSLAPNALDDVWTDIVAVADALDVPERGLQVAAEMRERLAAITRKARSLPTQPTIACIEWIDPLMAAGNWVPELVALAGGVNLFGEAGKHSPWMTWEQLVAADPDVIALMPCGFDIARTLQDVPLMARRPEWPTLRGVQANRVFVCDGNQYFNRPGPRLVESLEILAEMLHPQTFRFGHEWKGWQRV
jgi:iron complex transport system substrate-binding protein